MKGTDGWSPRALRWTGISSFVMALVLLGVALLQDTGTSGIWIWLALITLLCAAGGMCLFQASQQRRRLEGAAVPRDLEKRLQESQVFDEAFEAWLEPSPGRAHLIDSAQEEWNRRQYWLPLVTIGMCVAVAGSLRFSEEVWYPQMFGAILGLPALGFGLTNLFRQFRIRSWPTVRARVILSTVLVKEDQFFVPAVFRRYRIGGREYTAHLVHLSGPSGSLESARSISQRFKIGDEIECAVNPRDPKRSVIDRSVRPLEALAAFVVAAAGLAIGLFA